MTEHIATRMRRRVRARWRYLRIDYAKQGGFRASGPACPTAAGRTCSRWRSRSSCCGRCCGALFDFSDTWQLVINTATTIVTFLMVFLIQNTQNRDTEAIQVKLDELIRATKGAHNALLDLEELDDDEVDKFRKKYQLLADAARRGKPARTWSLDE